MHILCTTSFFGTKPGPKSQGVAGFSVRPIRCSSTSRQRPVKVPHRVNQSAAKDERVAWFTEGEVLGVEVLLKDITDSIEIVGESGCPDGNKRDVAVAGTYRDEYGTGRGAHLGLRSTRVGIRSET